MKIVADSKIHYLKGLLEQEGHEVCYIPGAEITSNEDNIRMNETERRPIG